MTDKEYRALRLRGGNCRCVLVPVILKEWRVVELPIEKTLKHALFLWELDLRTDYDLSPSLALAKDRLN